MDPTKLDFREIFGLEGVRRFAGSAAEQGLLKTILAFLAAMNDWFFHPTHTVVEVVMVLVVFDTLTGAMKAYHEGKLSSSGFFRFAPKIVIYVILMATGALLDKLAEGFVVKALTIVTTFLAMTEALSILENVGGLGYPIPKALISILKLAKDSTTKPDKGK